MIEAVIFDLDGTLIDLPVDYEQLFEKIREITKRENVCPLTETVSRLDEKTKKRVFKVWDEAELAATKKLRINKEGMTIYKKFSQKQKALVTMQGKALVKSTIKLLSISFDAIITREDSLSRIEQLEKASRKLRTPFNNLLFVGNTEGDTLAAEKTGCQFLRAKQQKRAQSNSKEEQSTKLLNNSKIG